MRSRPGNWDGERNISLSITEHLQEKTYCGIGKYEFKKLFCGYHMRILADMQYKKYVSVAKEIKGGGGGLLEMALAMAVDDVRNRRAAVCK